MCEWNRNWNWNEANLLEILWCNTREIETFATIDEEKKKNWRERDGSRKRHSVAFEIGRSVCMWSEWNDEWFRCLSDDIIREWRTGSRMKFFYGWIFVRFVFLAVVIVTRGGFLFLREGRNGSLDMEFFTWFGSLLAKIVISLFDFYVKF